MDFDAQLVKLAAATQNTLDALLPEVSSARGRVIEAMRYSALGGGKRLRPYLLISAADLFGVPREQSLRAAAAIEMVHCYSLVHDDLPEMDDSPLRRGRPTLHCAFDQALAVLAGDGLLTEAFAVLVDPATHPDAAVRCDLVAGLAEAAGAAGMVGGQTIDLSSERDQLDLDGIKELQALKTGAMIVEACRAGAVLGHATAEQKAALVAFARDLGLAFQIVDDLLDVEASAEEMGKPTGRDEDQGKATFVALLGLDSARKKARKLGENALCHLDLFDEKADALRHVVGFVLERRT